MDDKEQEEKIREICVDICDFTNKKIFENYEFLHCDGELDNFFKLLRGGLNHIKKSYNKLFKGKWKKK